MHETISWLHLSDRHTNSPNTGWDAARIIQTLLADLKELQQKHQLRPDLIFFTGDLGWGNLRPGQLSQQLAEGHQFLEAVRNAFDLPVPVENVFIVPGNHDIDREMVLPQQTDWLDNSASAELVNNLVRRGEREWAQYIDRLDEYRTFLKNNGYNHLLTDPGRLTFSARRQVANRSVGIAGFNSAWSCCREKEKSRLWIGGHWQAETLGTAIRNADVRIAMVHHPHSWFREEEANDFWRSGLQSQFHVILHGHEHEAWVDEVNGTVTISAAACYNRQDKPNGYNFVRLIPQERRGEVWLRKFDSRGMGWVPDHIASQTDLRGVRSLEWIKWLKPDNPPDGRGINLGGPDPNPSPEAIRANADAVTKAVQSVLGTQAHTQVVCEYSSQTSTSVGRESRSNTFIQQTIVVNINVSNAALSTSESAAAPTEAQSQFKEDFEQIDKLLYSYRIEDAQVAVDKLIGDHPELSARDQFRCFIKQGNISYARRLVTEAGARYRHAATYVPPDDKYSRYFLALASELLGDPSTAHTAAAALMHDLPDFEPAAVISILIRTAPQSRPVTELIERFGAQQCAKPEVAYTIAQRARDQGAMDLALEYIESAVHGKPRWNEARSTLAGVLIEKQFGKIVTAGHSRPAQPSWKDFERARDLLIEAAAEVERGQDLGHAAALRQNLAVVFTVVGRPKEAIAEYAKALKLTPDSPELIHRYTLTLGKNGQADEAVKVLRQWLQNHRSPEVTLLLAQFLGSRLTGEVKPTDLLDEPIALLEAGWSEVDSLPEQLKEDWIAVLVQFYVDAGNVAAAREKIQRLSSTSRDHPLYLLLLADIEKAAGDLAEAKKLALRAARLIGAFEHPTTIRQLAIALEGLEEFVAGAEVWQRIAKMDALGMDEQHLLMCLQRAGDREALISACQTLRRNGVYEEQTMLAELAALERTSMERFRQVLRELIDSPVSEKLRRQFRVSLLYSTVLDGDCVLTEAEIARLPSANEVEGPRIGRMVCEVLRHGPRPFGSIQFAYELFRRFPNDVDSHLAVIISAGLPENGGANPPEPSAVSAGVAIRYREHDAPSDTWCIVEDLPSPANVLSERPPSDPISRELIGKRVGDAFSFRTGSLQSRKGTIQEILSKFTYRIRDCIANFETRFPDHEPVVVKINAGGDGKEGLSVILRQLDEQAQRQGEIDELYRDRKLTVYLYGEATSRSVMEAVHRISASAPLKLYANAGSVGDKQGATSAMNRASAYVLDPTAIAILYILHSAGILKLKTLLSAINAEVVLSEYTLADARSALASLPAQGGLSLAKESGEYVRRHLSAEEAQLERDRLRDFIAGLRAACSIAAAEHPSPTDATSYQQLTQVIGRAGAESVRLAKAKADAVLWSDEVFTAVLARPSIGSRRVWTKHVIESLVGSLKLPAIVNAEATVLLYRIGYHFTGLNAEALMLAVTKSQWKSYQEPICSLLTQYSQADVTQESLIQSSSQFLFSLWSAAESTKDYAAARGITCRLVQEIAKRRDGQILCAYIKRQASDFTPSSQHKLRKQIRKGISFCMEKHFGIG